MKEKVSRYNLEKQFICEGIFEAIFDGELTTLNYTDHEIDVSTSQLYHPLSALMSLRQILESQYNSLLAINGNRIDTTLHSHGFEGTYVMTKGGGSGTSIDMFDPTTEIDKLGTIKEHEAAYDKWISTFFQNE